ncbi:MAG: pyruvate, phosphate dikinase [Candidatus Odinarchaeota archaeon]
MTDKKMIYSFSEGNKDLKHLLGEKGSGLGEMTSLGLPVPPGFTMTTRTSLNFLETGKMSKELLRQLWKAIEDLEERTKTRFGDVDHPLLVSVRSGSTVSMPGILESVLNIGLNDATVSGVVKIGDKRFAYDSYCRLLQMFGIVVKKIPEKDFQEIVDKKKIKRKVKRHAELHLEDLIEIVTDYKELYKKNGSEFPQDPKKQLIEAVEGSLGAWNSPKAIDYRKKNKIPDELGVAVTIQAQVFGNLGSNSATGHVFTRNPITGKKEFFGDFLPASQADDIFKTLRAPIEIGEVSSIFSSKVSDKLFEGISNLELRYKDMQFVEFVIQEGKLFFLQTARGIRSGAAAGQIAYDMVQEGLIDKKTAITMVSPEDIENSIYPRIDWYDPVRKNYSTLTGNIGYGFLAGKGQPAAPGAVSGKVTFTIDKMKEFKTGNVIYITEDITQENIQALFSADGIITTRGGLTSEAAILSRQKGLPCIVALEEVSGIKLVEKEHKYFLKDSTGREISEGDTITIDGFHGEIYHSELPITTPQNLPSEMVEILKWCDEISPIEIRATAHAKDAVIAFDNGAKGLGLVRSEYYFLENEKEKELIQRFALATNDEERKQFTQLLEQYQISDYLSLFRIAKGKPITIKIADFALQDFLPNQDELYEDIEDTKYEIYRLAIQEQDYIQDKQLLETARKIAIFEKMESINQQNPMLGLRGCRLGLIYPMLIEMQITAIFKAAIQVLNDGIEVQPEITIPLISFEREFDEVRKIIDKTAKKVLEKSNAKIKYQVGCMIETPRAALIAGKIAQTSDFLLIGNNDLSQTTLGFSRIDAERFIHVYLDNLIYDVHPFLSVEAEGVGRLIKICVEEARQSKQDLRIGITGEQASDPDTIDFCYHLGVNYLSCAPYKMPVALLAAAQAKIKSDESS